MATLRGYGISGLPSVIDWTARGAACRVRRRQPIGPGGAVQAGRCMVEGVLKDRGVSEGTRGLGAERAGIASHAYEDNPNRVAVRYAIRYDTELLVGQGTRIGCARHPRTHVQIGLRSLNTTPASPPHTRCLRPQGLPTLAGPQRTLPGLRLRLGRGRQGECAEEREQRHGGQHAGGAVERAPRGGGPCLGQRRYGGPILRTEWRTVYRCESSWLLLVIVRGYGISGLPSLRD